MRVLFVDDEPNVLSGIRRMLRPYRKQWHMRFVTSGKEALAAMEEEPAELIVSDIRMPGMSGVELLQQVRDRWPQTLRMVLSGESDRDALLQALGPTHQYLCKPCQPEALVAALERMCAMLEMIDGEDLRATAGDFDALPTPSNTFAAAMAVFDDPDGTAAQLSHVIKSDVGMSTALLRVANSAYVGLSADVTSVQRAIQLLGLDLVQAILMVAGVLQSTSDSPGISRILARSRQVSQKVHELARDASPEIRRQAELAAMLHNIGAIVLMHQHPDAYEKLSELTGVDRELAEREHFGTTQALIGAYLLGVWGLPAPVMLAVAHQDETLDDEQPGPGLYLHEALSALEEVA